MNILVIFRFFEKLILGLVVALPMETIPIFLGMGANANKVSQNNANNLGIQNK